MPQGVLSLRTTDPECDVGAQLLLERHGKRRSRTSAADVNTLLQLTPDDDICNAYEYLSVVREYVASSVLTASDNYERASQGQTILQQYAHALWQCLQQPEVSQLTTLTIPWSITGTTSSSSSTTVALGHSLSWEYGHVVMNLCILQAQLALAVPSSSNTNAASPPLPQQKQVWNQAVQTFQTAASVLHHVRTKTLTNLPKNSPESWYVSHVLVSYEWYLLAEGQRAAYHVFLCMSPARPKHFMLAQLAAAAIPLYQNAEQAIEDGTHQEGSTDLMSFGLDADVVRSMSMYMTALAEYHQAKVHEEKKEVALEVARLERALRFATLCLDFCACSTEEESSKSTMNEAVFNYSLVDKTRAMVNELEQRLSRLEHHVMAQVAPTSDDELVEIRPKQTVKIMPAAVNKVLPPVAPRLGFDVPANAVDASANEDANSAAQSMSAASASSEAKAGRGINNMTGLQEALPLRERYIVAFQREMEQRVSQLAIMEEGKTDSARRTLSKVNLPHSLTAYRQEQNGGGIPEELWGRVRAVQEAHTVNRLKQELWELRDLADSARVTYDRIKNLLDEDAQMDELFRQQHQDFEGHNVPEVQRSFRKALENYGQPIAAAQASDELLMERLQILETDPKFRLLRFQKSQLDHLLPQVDSSSSHIDVTSLSRYLIDLSAVFDEREVILETLRQRVKTYDVSKDLERVDSRLISGDPQELEEAYGRAVEAAIQSFQPMFDDMYASIEDQKKLLQMILDENKVFMQARESSRSVSGDSCIVKIEDALEEIEQFSKHLSEGKAFYDLIIPKLDKLKQQVEDVSARLTIERCEFDDKVRRARQEEEDARMAASLADRSSSLTSGTQDGNSGISNSPSSSRNGETSAANGGRNGHSSRPSPSTVAPPARASRRASGLTADGSPVDDEKVASLISMDFDPENVVKALKKTNNNVEEALNHLLSGDL